MVSAPAPRTFSFFQMQLDCGESGAASPDLTFFENYGQMCGPMLTYDVHVETPFVFSR
jgi:hypothetical protein